MNMNQIKFLALSIITITLFVIVLLNSTTTQSYAVGKKDAAATYKTQCAACHKATAEKFFDPAIADEALVDIILKGKKGAKPPFMPGFGSKGMTAEQAQELVVYMRKLRAAVDSNSETTVSNVNATANTNANTNANANTNCNNSNSAVNSNVNTNVNSTVEAAPDASAIAEATATYKTKCMACHTAKAGKFFASAKSDDQLIEAILKGMKGAKPPFMPGFGVKGMKPEQARALVYYMRQLKASVK
jgi:mono/diheme cytochrome c family protein